MTRIAAALAGRLSGRIARGAVGTFGLKLFHIGLRFLVVLLLARMLGAAGYGAYSFAIAAAGLLTVPAVVGLDGLLIRELAACQARSQWGLMRGLLWRGNQISLAASVGLALAAAVVAWALASRLEPEMLSALWIGLIVVPVVALSRLAQGAMIGLRHVVRAQVPESIIQPLLYLCFVGAAVLMSDKGLTAPLAVALYVVAAVAGLATAAGLLFKALPAEVKVANPEYRMGPWARSSLKFALIGGMSVIGAGASIVILGVIKGSEVTGIYSIANVAAGLVSFALISVNTPLAPVVAGLYAAGDRVGLQRLVTKSARAVLMVSLPIAGIYVLFGHWILLLFGAEFVRGYTALVILTFGQLVNAAMGSVGLLLTMTGHEREATIGIAIGALVNVVLNLALIPTWGIEGAALATAAGMIVWNVVLAVWVYRRLGLDVTALGKLIS